MSNPFTIPQKEGLHEWRFEVGDGFWEKYPESGVTGSKVEVRVEAREKGEGEKGERVELKVVIEGVVKATCDRCLDECELPTKWEETLEMEWRGGELDLEQYIYESIILGLPLLRVHEEKAQCNQEILKRINN